MGFVSHFVVPTTVPQPRHPPWLLTGSLGLVTLFSFATMGMLRLPLPFSRAFALRSASDTPESLPVSWRTREESSPAPSDLGSPVWSVLRLLLLRGDRRLSQLPRRPRCRFAVLSDPGRTSTPDLCGASVLPPLSSRRRLPLVLKFRGSITRLRGSLPTLEDAISGRQPRVASGGWSILSGRAGSRRVSPVAFSCSLSVSPFICCCLLASDFPAAQGFGWRQMNVDC